MTSGSREVKGAAERVLEQSTRLLEQRLKLKVNVAKSVIAPAATAVLLGRLLTATSSGVRLRIAPKAWLGKAQSCSPTSRWVCRWITGCGGSASTCGAGWDISGWRTRPGSSPTWTDGIAVGCDRSGGRNGNGRGRRWRICVPSGFGLIWPGGGACPVVVAGVLREVPDSAPGVCRPAIGRNVVSCSFTQPGPGFERPSEPPDARPARPVV